MAYRVFTEEDLKPYYDRNTSVYPRLSAPYRALNWNIFWNEHSLRYAVGFAMKTENQNDYKANPTKLILRRHINIESIDGWNNGPVFPDV